MFTDSSMPEDTTQHVSSDLLAQVLLAGLPESALSDIARHLRECPACREEMPAMWRAAVQAAE